MQIQKSSGHQLAGPPVRHATRSSGSLHGSLSSLTPVLMLMRRSLSTRSCPSCPTLSSTAEACTGLARQIGEIIVPFPAGGPLDFTARLLAEKLSARLPTVSYRESPWRRRQCRDQGR